MSLKRWLRPSREAPKQTLFLPQMARQAKGACAREANFSAKRCQASEGQIADKIHEGIVSPQS